ncbi:hypothetical protein BH09ACT7_BH09ACT7_59250 [soil metagenome]
MSESAPEHMPRLGLVLGGGAALGAAHAGVLEVFERAGISFPVVAGTSAGGLIGAGYAAGLSSRVIIDAILAATWSDLAQFSGERRWGLLDTSPLEQSIEKHIAVGRIEDLPRRFGALAWDMRAREAVLLTEGALGSALRATSAVPGLFPPVRIGERLLVDGAVADNLPVWAARVLGADLVIAVDVDRSADTRAGRARETLREVRRRAAAISSDRPPEVVIYPDTAGAPRWSPKAVPELIAAGRQAAEAALPAIAAAIAHTHST